MDSSREGGPWRAAGRPVVPAWPLWQRSATVPGTTWAAAADSARGSVDSPAAPRRTPEAIRASSDRRPAADLRIRGRTASQRLRRSLAATLPARGEPIPVDSEEPERPAPAKTKTRTPRSRRRSFQGHAPRTAQRVESETRPVVTLRQLPSRSRVGPRAHPDRLRAWPRRRSRPLRPRRAHLASA